MGTAGTTPFGVKDDLHAALARQVLEDNGAPTTDLQMVLGSTAIANLRGKQSVLFKVNESALNSYREGVLGRLDGIQYSQFGRCETSAKGCCNWLSREWREKEGDVLISIDTLRGDFCRSDCYVRW